MEPPRKFVQQSSSLEKRRSLRLQAEINSLATRGQSKRRIAIALAVFVCATAMIVCSPETLFAQTPTATPAPVPTASPAPAAPAEPDGITRGGYQIHSVHRTRLPDYRRDRQRRYVRHTGESTDGPANS